MKIVRVGKTGTIGDSGGEDGLEILWVLPFLRGGPGVCDVGDDRGLIALLVNLSNIEIWQNHHLVANSFHI